ncbi:hypothetical protein O6H91_12G004700 [Diphasiastrum complanatum]|nr:hypothetical protein O6H91_12G004700 [Diphasiastrum complanatum]
MPPICSPQSRPGRPAEAACTITEQLTNALKSSELVDLHELSIAPGKAAWMAYLDIYCLDADGSLLDAALLASVSALAHLQIPSVAMTEEGTVIPALPETGISNHLSNDKHLQQPTVSEQRRLKLGAIPWSLTCALYKKHVLADPTAEEETVLHTILTVIIDSSGRLVAFYKPGGSIPATTNIIQECISLAKRRSKELQRSLDEAITQYESET